jgi:hypothetical protein
MEGKLSVKTFKQTSKKLDIHWLSSSFMKTSVCVCVCARALTWEVQMRKRKTGYPSYVLPRGYTYTTLKGRHQCLLPVLYYLLKR